VPDEDPVDEGRLSSSGIPLRPAYGPEDVPEETRAASAVPPGRAPFVRGAYPGMYRSKPWRIFQLSGFGNPEDERERLLFLLEQGEHGIIMEHDRNTADHLYDVDHPDVAARHEDVGLTGAVIVGVRDFETILDGIPIDELYVHPGGAVVQHAPFALACYWTVARRRGIDLRTLAGTGQSDFFLTYVGCFPKQQIPPQAGLRLNLDIVDFCLEHLPRWVPVSIAGYNGADSGLSGPDELATVFATAIEYLDGAKARGHEDLSGLAHRVGGVNFRVGMDLFEDVAKLRAARKLWSDLLERRYGITDERARQLRIHVVTAGSAMTYQQPLNNVVRGTLMALASVLGGVQSLGVSGYDEALSIPSEHAHQMSVRIQQILLHETNVDAVADPLGGSYYVEALTAELEERALAALEEIEEQGGFVAALDAGWIHDRAAARQGKEIQALEDGSRTVVGVNAFETDVTPWPVDGFQGSTDAWERAMERLADVRSSRDRTAWQRAIRALEAACRGSANVMPAMLDAVAADATVGEVGEVFRSVWGDWRAPVSL
jgi:methylmalonyl-CoA mutase, N-terminal domain